MRTTENTSNIRSLTDAELDEVSGGSLLAEVWNAYTDVYKVVFGGNARKYVPLEGHLQR